MTSERWAGFTDEDIERIKSNPKAIKSCSEKMCDLKDRRKRGPMKIKNAPVKIDHEEHSNDIHDVNSICNETKTKEMSSLKEQNRNSHTNSNENYSLENENHCICNTSEFEEVGVISVKENATVTDICSDKKENKSEETNPSNNNMPSLELFEMRQKRIEEENARRRVLIVKAIKDKHMQTHAEAAKLAKITYELNRIDSNLSSDVFILRNYIEKASIEFSEAEKRYLKAEKEFVEAKLFLFEKMQRKEMLTEHLCAIIEQNENRKADKLVELMKQLEMDVTVDDCEVQSLEPILPNLCTLNGEPYPTCQTIKPSLSKENSQKRISGLNREAEDCPGSLKMDENISDSVNTAGSSSVEDST